MLKALLLIFDPINTWDKIEQARVSLVVLIFTFLLPLLLLTSAVEGYGLARLGRIDPISNQVKVVPQEVVLRFETVQLALSILILAGGSWFLKQVGEGFHRRHSYSETFVTVAYSLSPLFLMRMFNGLPMIDSWICWGVGMVFAIAALYRGIPRVMKPDPSNALGIYLMACLLFLFVTGLSHFVATMVLDEKIMQAGWSF